MSACKVLAVEGLPGAGKTSTVRRLGETWRCGRRIDEYILSYAGPRELADFCRNDRAKEALAKVGGLSIMDRFWLSTACYELARATPPLEMHPATIAKLCARFGGSWSPDAIVFLDSPWAVSRAFARDGLFAELDFRVRLRRAYGRVLEVLQIPTLYALPTEFARIEEFARGRLFVDRGGK
jgi:thymidylate kinase